MLIATPLHGRHYLFEVLVGIALAIVCIDTARNIMSRVGGREPVSVRREFDWIAAR